VELGEREAILAKLRATPADQLTPEECRILLAAAQKALAKLECVKADDRSLCVAWPHGGESAGAYQVLANDGADGPLAAVALVDPEEYSDPVSSMYYGDDGKIRYVIPALKPGTQYKLQVIGEGGWTTEIVSISTTGKERTKGSVQRNKVIAGKQTRQGAPTVSKVPFRSGKRHLVMAGKVSYKDKTGSSVLLTDEERAALLEGLSADLEEEKAAPEEEVPRNPVDVKSTKYGLRISGMIQTPGRKTPSSNMRKVTRRTDW